MIDGISFASALEAQVYAQLKFREKIGDIKELVIHPSFQLTRFVRWKPDFKYFCLKRNQTIVAEAKGVNTADFLVKLNLWKEFGKHVLEIYRGSWKRPFLAETITPETLQKASP